MLIWGYLLRQVRRWRTYRRTYNELVSLDDRTLADINISRSEIPGIARHAATTVH
jgi:uncharacterized protein YjiS (DUF1127 family)